MKKARFERKLDLSLDLDLKEILMRLKLAENSNLTNAAVLLFGKNPQEIFPQAEVKCIRFKGTETSAPMLDFKDLRGDIASQIVKSEKFIFENISLTSWIAERKIEREEKWEYPPHAIREALVNAICHRDYRSPSKTQVRIFDDRIEFWNPGKLPEGWTTETLKEKHDSQPFNPLIAKIFFLMKYIEEVGTGTNKIIQWSKEWDLPEPDFSFTGTSLAVTIWKSKLTEKFLASLDLSDREKEIIEMLKKTGKVTSGEIQRKFNISRYTANRYFNKLLDLKIIERKGKGKKIYYELLGR